MRYRIGIVAIATTAMVQTAFAVDYTVGLRFADGDPHEQTIAPDETTTLELFITTVDDLAQMKEFLTGFTASSVTAGGTFDDLGFTRSQELLANTGTYGSSVLTGPFNGSDSHCRVTRGPRRYLGTVHGVGRRHHHHRSTPRHIPGLG